MSVKSLLFYSIIRFKLILESEWSEESIRFTMVFIFFSYFRLERREWSSGFYNDAYIFFSVNTFSGN